MCFPGKGKTCMPSVRQLVDHLVAARSIPIRCGPCLNIKNTTNTYAADNNNKNYIENSTFHLKNSINPAVNICSDKNYNFNNIFPKNLENNINMIVDSTNDSIMQ